MSDDNPLSIIRYARGPDVFGLKKSRLKSKIDSGEIPAPIPLSESGHALGWTRAMIAAHHERMATLAAERRAAAALLPIEKKPKPPALVKANKNKIKKLKLRPPAKVHQRQRTR